MAAISIINILIPFIALIVAFLLGALVFWAGTRVSFVKENGYYPPLITQKAPESKKPEPEKKWDDV